MAWEINIEEKGIEAIKTWPKSPSFSEIPLFLDFQNFYKKFIKNFSRIAVPLTLIY